jgi:methyltransferase
VDTRHAYTALIALVAAERLVELALTRRNWRWARPLGGREYGRGHYPWMVAVHASFLAACAAEVWLLERPFRPALAAAMLALVAGAMALRYWAIAALGRRWSTRVVVVPGMPAVTGGPYRWMRHPNYLAVIVETAALPLVHGAWLTAIAYSLLNGVLLTARVRAEEAALQRHAGYGELFGARGRFLPRASQGPGASGRRAEP